MMHQQHPAYISDTQLGRGEDFSVLHLAKDSPTTIHRDSTRDTIGGLLAAPPVVEDLRQIY